MLRLGSDAAEVLTFARIIVYYTISSGMTEYIIRVCGRGIS